MLGQMQTHQLAVPHIFHRAERLFADQAIVTIEPEGGRRTADHRTTDHQTADHQTADHQTSVGDWADRVRRLATALDRLGLAPDARVGTLSRNTQPHLEAYFAVPLTGRILHTINMRLSPAQLAYVVDHALDEALLIDRGLLGLILPLAPRLASVRHWIVMEDGSDAPIPDDPRLQRYEDMITAAPPHVGEFVIPDENRASGLCYTSGTTGAPKGVLYSHRSTVLHSLGMLAADSAAISESDTVFPVVPMFHVNAWGLPYAAVLAGAKLVLAGITTEPRDLLAAIERHRVTMAAGATTVWNLAAPALRDYDLSSLRMVMSGGSATPAALSETWLAEAGIPITHTWGMTETSPLAVINRPRPEHGRLPADEQVAMRARQGRPVPMVDLRLVSEDGDLQPWDGETVGEVEVAGPWVASRYYRHDDGESFRADGWLRTGDLATIDEHGYLKIVDRLKDIIKSGGEWISSVELENAMMAHPDIAEAAVVGRPDDTWAERPVACIVLHAGRVLSPSDVIEHLRPLVAKWWLPDAVIFLPEIPKTGTGKFSKAELRRLVIDGARPAPE